MIDHIRLFSCDLIVADPPWRFELYSEATGSAKGPAAQYPTMSLDEIKALRVGELAGGDCLLMLWATGCMLPHCLDVMKAWGFTYKSEMVWNKRTRLGKWRVGPGYRVRTMHEPILLGTVGNPSHQPFPSAFDGLAREHSRKPEEFYGLVDRYAPALRGRADLFARTQRPGWMACGNETEKFPAVAA